MPPAPLAIDGNRLVRQDTREPVKIRGINWFGFNVAREMVDGLGHGGSNAQTDFATIVYQLKYVSCSCLSLPMPGHALGQCLLSLYSGTCVRRVAPQHCAGPGGSSC